MQTLKNVNLKSAVLKYLKIEMLPISSNNISAY